MFKSTLYGVVYNSIGQHADKLRRNVQQGIKLQIRSNVENLSLIFKLQIFTMYSTNRYGGLRTLEGFSFIIFAN
jgi:hypothetical protein